MKHRHPVLTLGAFIFSVLILFSCKKINEATTLGGDLIPPVDNITTFDTLLDVQAFNDTFSIVTDSTLSYPDYEQFLGVISNDPFFGKTDAQLFLELKPPAYKFSFLGKPDSLHIDSVVLILDHTNTYGDSTVAQSVNVYEINVPQITDFRYDTSYLLRQNGLTRGPLLGSRTFLPSVLNDSVKAYKDTTARQLRIRLNDSFGARLLAYDSTGSTGVYASDSNFRSNFKGFALESVSGNALMGFTLQGVNTKLAIYYKDDNGDAPVDKWDTAVSYFSFTSVSASANLIKRDYAGSPLALASNGTTLPPDNFAYIQAVPGSFALLKIPGLAGLNNRIVHRAELIMEQAYDLSDTLFPPPVSLYVDAYDPATTKFNTVPYDFTFDPSSGVSNVSSFGATPYLSVDPLGRVIKVWRFNLSRYVQHVVTGTEPAYDLRVYAPTYTFNEYRPNPSIARAGLTVTVNAAPVKGRVRLFGGDPTHTNPQRMRVRIVYSKI